MRDPAALTRIKRLTIPPAWREACGARQVTFEYPAKGAKEREQAVADPVLSSAFPRSALAPSRLNASRHRR